ncbi:hypothetical protein HJG60_008141 [Phyllostomus discolor]|uniref:Uncharacterized protein n=1 Tax=Phyllostomus discolor TaxID=89673 RepID=A0A834DLV3_9CHIR|nr:hypothetical protein HJG60_008141 [Phyllostomus discolor]
MFLKLRRLLSQQAVLIKTMFHLFLMIINGPCNEGEKKSFLPGKLYHPVAKQIHHREASVPTFLGSGKFFPWRATLPGLPVALNVSAPCSDCLQISEGLAAWSQRPRTVNSPADNDGFAAGKNRRDFFRKGAPAWCPSVPPCCHCS